MPSSLAVDEKELGAGLVTGVDEKDYEDGDDGDEWEEFDRLIAEIEVETEDVKPEAKYVLFSR